MGDVSRRSGHINYSRAEKSNGTQQDIPDDYSSIKDDLDALKSNAGGVKAGYADANFDKQSRKSKASQLVEMASNGSRRVIAEASGDAGKL